MERVQFWISCLPIHSWVKIVYIVKEIVVFHYRCLYEASNLLDGEQSLVPFQIVTGAGFIV